MHPIRKRCASGQIVTNVQAARYASGKLTKKIALCNHKKCNPCADGVTNVQTQKMYPMCKRETWMHPYRNTHSDVKMPATNEISAKKRNRNLNGPIMLVMTCSPKPWWISTKNSINIHKIEKFHQICCKTNWINYTTESSRIPHEHINLTHVDLVQDLQTYSSRIHIMAHELTSETQKPLDRTETVQKHNHPLKLTKQRTITTREWLKIDIWTFASFNLLRSDLKWFYLILKNSKIAFALTSGINVTFKCLIIEEFQSWN